LEHRFANRSSSFIDVPTYEDARKNPTEKNIERLAKTADIVIDTARCTPEDVLARVAAQLGLHGGAVRPVVDVLVGGQYGSEGKGQIAAFLAPEYDLLVRVGGPNAGHSVYEEPEPFVFHHLPSGTRCSEAAIVLGPGATILVPGLLEEISLCKVSAQRLSIDPQAMIIEESDREQEGRTLRTSIASTAQGVGAATSRKILRTAADPPVRLASDVVELRPFVRPTQEILDDAFATSKKVFLEGTQGSGLSIHHGSYPYVTSRDTTVAGCISEAGIAPSRVRRIVLVYRTLPIRVESPKGGTSGPMSREISFEEVSARSGVPIDDLEERERTSTTRRKRRIGEFDWYQLRRSALLNGPTDIALTFADYISAMNRDARRFEQLTTETLRFVEEVERVAKCPVTLIATRFHSRSIIDRRSW
jgi:adenylosuccinate synthase